MLLLFSSGKGLGALIGGHMYHHMGARKTFRFFTMYSIISSIIFFMFHLLYIRRRSRKISDLPIFGIDPSEALLSVELSRMASKHHAGRSQHRGSIAYLTDSYLENAVVEVIVCMLYYSFKLSLRSGVLNCSAKIRNHIFVLLIICAHASLIYHNRIPLNFCKSLIPLETVYIYFY